MTNIYEWFGFGLTAGLGFCIGGAVYKFLIFLLTCYALNPVK